MRETHRRLPRAATTLSVPTARTTPRARSTCTGAPLICRGAYRPSPPTTCGTGSRQRRHRIGRSLRLSRRAEDGTRLKTPITGLSSYTPYEAQVRSVNSDGSSDWAPETPRLATTAMAELTIAFSAASYQVNEGETATVTVLVEPASDRAAEVEIGGVSGDDITVTGLGNGNILSMPRGSASVDFTIAVDEDNDQDDTIVDLWLGNTTNKITLGSQDTSRVIVKDGPTPTPRQRLRRSRQRRHLRRLHSRQLLHTHANSYAYSHADANAHAYSYADTYTRRLLRHPRLLIRRRPHQLIRRHRRQRLRRRPRLPLSGRAQATAPRASSSCTGTSPPCRKEYRPSPATMFGTGRRHRRSLAGRISWMSRPSTMGSGSRRPYRV